jgi:hypothetical protein
MKIPFAYNPSRFCPCGSTKAAKDHCLQSGNEWLKSPTFKPLSIPKTGVSNEKCYLAKTQGCSNKISGEHYVSKTVLKAIGDGNAVTMEGLPWMKSGDKKELFVETLTTNILCVEHNNRLSPIDSEAGRLFRSLREIDEKLGFDNQKNKIYIFCGEDLEKWMLKTLCNIFALYNKPNDKKVPELWIDILYDQTSWPKGWGMYLRHNENQDAYHSRSLKFRSCDDGMGNVVAFEMNIYGLPFLLAVSEAFKPKEQNLVFRPRRLQYESNGNTKVTEITWQSNLYEEIIYFQKIGSKSGKPPS